VRIELPRYDIEAALGLERSLGVSHAMAQVLVRRGLSDPGRAAAFLACDEEHPPEAFAGIQAAVESIRARIDSGQPIVVHGDYDVDGVCATAIMVRALRALGARVSWFIPDRSADGYGLARPTVERLARSGAALIVAVDCGITAVEEVAAARRLGVDVVVCDHHAPRSGGGLPACPIVHPALGGYPCPDLCGAAVAHKLAQALGSPTASEDLELVALATVCDLVALVGENRRLVRAGLAQLATTAKPGLRALIAVAGCDPMALDAGALGFGLGPRLNACGRMARADAGVELLLCEDPVRARAIAAELDALNAQRRAVEQRTLWEAEAQLRELGPRRGYVLAGEGWHPGVIGIVASRIVERHHRPTVLVALDGERGRGSARGVPGFHLLHALDACAAHLTRHGGHRAAAGMELQAGAVDAFRQAFERHCELALTDELLAVVERADAVVSGTELGLELAEELRALEPCGAGNPAPRLLVCGARFDGIRTMGDGRHARFTVMSGGVRASAVAFGCDGRVTDDPSAPQDATFRLERDSWAGAVAPRLVLRRARRTLPAPITVLERCEDYLCSALSELDAPLPELASPGGPARQGQPPRWRSVLDRRGHSPLSALADAVAGGGDVLAVCCDVERRLPGLRDLTGGFALASHWLLERDRRLPDAFPAIVALDPPGSPEALARLREGSGVLLLAWGEPELRFAQKMHELEYGLRSTLVALYRALRDRGRAGGEELERLLRGDPPGRPARLAGRAIRVLVELGLVTCERERPALAIAGRSPTSLERSPAYRAYARRHEEGRRFLSTADLPAAA